MIASLLIDHSPLISALSSYVISNQLVNSEDKKKGRENSREKERFIITHSERRPFHVLETKTTDIARPLIEFGSELRSRRGRFNWESIKSFQLPQRWFLPRVTLPRDTPEISFLPNAMSVKFKKLARYAGLELNLEIYNSYSGASRRKFAPTLCCLSRKITRKLEPWKNADKTTNGFTPFLSRSQTIIIV